MNLQEIHIHDCLLHRVEEFPETGELLFFVTYPVNWEKNEFAPRIIAFTGVLQYHVDEGPFAGGLTLLSYDIRPCEHDRTRVVFETTAGQRSLLFNTVELCLPVGELGPLDGKTADR